MNSFNGGFDEVVNYNVFQPWPNFLLWKVSKHPGQNFSNHYCIIIHLCAVCFMLNYKRQTDVSCFLCSQHSYGCVAKMPNMNKTRRRKSCSVILLFFFGIHCNFWINKLSRVLVDKRRIDTIYCISYFWLHGWRRLSSWPCGHRVRGGPREDR